MHETVLEKRTMATSGIVSIETHWRELEIFYLSLQNQGLGSDHLAEGYQELQNRYDKLDRKNQEAVDKLDSNLIEFKVLIMLQLAKHAKKLNKIIK